MGSFCLQSARSYRGPLIAIGIGVGFMIVGSVPVAITFALNAKNSATIIGVGFIGFGLLVLLPGVCWCIVRRLATLRCCQSKQEQLHRPDDEYAAEDEIGNGTKLPSKSIASKVCFAMDNEHCNIKSPSNRGSDVQLDVDLDADVEDHVHRDEGDVILMR